jgi:hypothetical protein
VHGLRFSDDAPIHQSSFLCDCQIAP